MYTSVVNFFQDGGPFMYLILMVLAIGIAIALERYIYLSVSRRNNRRLLVKLMPLMQKGDYQSAYNITAKSGAAVSQMLSQGIARMKSASNRDDIETAMEETMMEAIPRLEKRTHYLAMFANIATLLGLLGTIIGLIEAFTAVSKVDPAQKAEILSSSISVMRAKSSTSMFSCSTSTHNSSCFLALSMTSPPSSHTPQWPNTIFLSLNSLHLSMDDR